MVDFFFNDTATTEIYTLSLHDALPIYRSPSPRQRVRRLAAASALPGLSRARKARGVCRRGWARGAPPRMRLADRKSTRLNSSHANISYAVFCLKKIKATDAVAHDFNTK